MFNRKPGARLTIEEEKDIMFYYLCTNMKVLEICSFFSMDRKTLYRVVNKHHYPIRNPRFGNRTNHPPRKRGESA